MDKNIDFEVLKGSYDFTISVDGEIMGLTAGDHHYEPTGIFLSEDTLEIWSLGVEKHKYIK